MRLLVILALALLAVSGKEFEDYKDYIKSQFGYDPHRISHSDGHLAPRKAYQDHNAYAHQQRHDEHPDYYEQLKEHNNYGRLENPYGHSYSRNEYGHEEHGYGKAHEERQGGRFSYGYGRKDYGFSYKPHKEQNGYGHSDIGYGRVRDLYGRDDYEGINFADFHYYGYQEDKFIEDDDNGFVPRDDKADIENYKWSYGINNFYLPRDVEGYDPAWDEDFERRMLGETGFPVEDIPDASYETYYPGLDRMVVREVAGPQGFPAEDVPGYDNEEKKMFELYGSTHPDYDVYGYDPILDKNLLRKIQMQSKERGHDRHDYEDYGHRNEHYGEHHEDYGYGLRY
eukprot:TRINITY_DN167_c0_g1_i6.p2 TRINITY_DN167_c0_g1~~TRINITY_DN167_c0_g1_i6.p2  ORF type:complete len:340 (-),score=2.06 TRINITY_DN167_c0_g1_i6:79-1098(-)